MPSNHVAGEWLGARRPYHGAVLGKRFIVDYGLQRRALLEELRSGYRSTIDVCDADQYLLRAAKFHGEPTARTCPVCRRGKLVDLTHVFGDELGQYSGRIKASTELAELSREHGEIRVYIVEVCQQCGWNHLVTSFLVGDGEPRRPPPRRRTVEDEYR